MELGARILYYTVWLVVAIAGSGIVYHSLARRDLRSDTTAIKERGKRVGRPVATLMKTLRERLRPLPPAARIEFQGQQSVGIRVSLFLVIPVLALGAYLDSGHAIEVVVWGAMIVPALTLPIGVAHTYLLRFLGSRGVVTSTVTGVVLGIVFINLLRQPDFTKGFAIYGGVYGLIIGLGNKSLFAPPRIADDAPRTLEEQARADGL